MAANAQEARLDAVLLQEVSVEQQDQDVPSWQREASPLPQEGQQR